jgi:hypothetical protein
MSETLQDEAGARLTSTQLRIFDDLLAIGGARPTAPDGLVDDLRRRVTEGTAAALGRWQEPTLWFGKSSLAAVQRCEGQVLVDASTPRRRGLHPATAVGIVVHRAIQLSYTHPDRTPDAVVRAALAGARSEEEFAAFWDRADDSTQSDLMVASVNRLCGFLDTFPRLEPSWVPRFEDSTVARLGRLVLSAKPDLTLGRPRGDGRQTMFLTDFKSGDLRDEHVDEAMFYALVATLRHGVPPFRSCVVSLASGEWSAPDVTAARLTDIADKVVAGIQSRVDVLCEVRPPTLSPGRHCSWCEAAPTCPAAAQWEEAGRPHTHAITIVGLPRPDDRLVFPSDELAGGPPSAPTSQTIEPLPVNSDSVADMSPPSTTDNDGDGDGDNPWLV